MGLSSGKNLNFMKWVTILLDYVRLDHSLTGIYCRGFAVVTAHSCLRRITPAKVVTTNGSVQSARSPVQSKRTISETWSVTSREQTIYRTTSKVWSVASRKQTTRRTTSQGSEVERIESFTNGTYFCLLPGFNRVGQSLVDLHVSYYHKYNP
jgi:hypothetical protein